MPTPTHVAFLRAVNVGGRTAHKEQLVAAALSTGATDASTFIASGNLLFRPCESPSTPSEVETALEAALARELGFDTEVFVRSHPQLASIAEGDPFDRTVDLDSGTYNVGFLRCPPSVEVVARLVALSSDVDRLTSSEREVHWHTAGTMSDSPLFTRPTMDRVIGAPMTMRNIRTIRRLVDKLTD